MKHGTRCTITNWEYTMVKKIILGLFLLSVAPLGMAALHVADQPSTIPEPATLALLGIGAIAMGISRKRKK